MLKYLVVILALALFVSAQTRRRDGDESPAPTPAPEAPCCRNCNKEVIVPKYKKVVKIIDIPVPTFKYPPQIVDKCPSDFTFVAPNKCVKKIIVNTPCPAGWIAVDDKTCIKVLKLKIDIEQGCPPGYKKLKGACIRIEKEFREEEIEELVCPKGWFKKGPYHCQKEEVCPEEGGYKWVDGRCIRIVKCPPGFKKIGEDKCINTVCPPGFFFDNKKNVCKKIEVVCPPGFKLIKGTDKCIIKKCWKVSCPPPSKCPEGTYWKIPAGECCARCVSCDCPTKLKLVCGQDGTTYPNECVAKCLGAPLKSWGKCEIVTKECPPNWNRNQSCEDKCLSEPFAPVCTADNITVPNECTANCWKLTVVSRGKCAAVCPKPAKSRDAAF